MTHNSSWVPFKPPTIIHEDINNRDGIPNRLRAIRTYSDSNIAIISIQKRFKTNSKIGHDITRDFENALNKAMERSLHKHIDKNYGTKNMIKLILLYSKHGHTIQLYCIQRNARITYTYRG